MLETLSLFPFGESYVRIPRSKAAAMRLLLETVQRGSRYWTGGTIPTHKALSLAEKFAHRYGTDLRASQRSRNKAKGITNSRLVVYPDNDQALEPLRWWLLVSPGNGPVQQMEHLEDAWSARGRLTWGEQYVLVHLQKNRAYGGGRHWTWQMQSDRYDALVSAMDQYAAGHGHPGRERKDDLQQLILAIRRMPGFHGIRQQQRDLFARGRELWERTHREPFLGWPEKLIYVDKRLPVFHRPHPLTLDVLVRMWERHSDPDPSTVHRI